jgi:hypothetical protein
MKKVYIILIGFLMGFSQADLFSQVFLYEGFEDGNKPEGWTEEYVVGEVNWRYRNGGYNPSDPNLDNPITPNGEVDIARNPPAAYEGNYNAFFFNQGIDNERTKLITPEMNMMGAIAVELSFYLCQIPWTFEGSTGWDILRVYYKVSETDPWVLLHEYLDPIYTWEKQILNLPNSSETYYVAFEGQARWGFGTCVDSVHIIETGIQQLYVNDIVCEQPFSLAVPSGSSNVPMLRADVKVYGNSGTLTLDQITFTSLNTSDTDLSTNGVKLYSTTTQDFITDNPLGPPTSFSSGEATFMALNHNLFPGHNYLWLAYDVALEAPHKNRLDAMVGANDVVTSGGTYPPTDQSPLGEREIYHTVFNDEFEGSLNWTLTGEFQIGTPTGNGGDPGNPDPVGAHSGVNAMGTDLTGLGANPYNYEPNLTEGTADMAASGNLNLLYYKDLNLFFYRHLNTEVWDRAAIEVSTDDGATWGPVWESNNYINDFKWNQRMVAISSQYWRSDQLRMRFSMGPTNGANNFSGWNIDDVYLTGEFISKDVGVSDWISPQSGSGHTSSDSVTVRIRNYGGAAITDRIPVAYSFNGGSSWTTDYMDTDIPVDGSVEFTFLTPADLSQPGLRPSVIAKTVLPGDQFASNNQFTTQIYVVPSYTPPHDEDFEESDGYWRSFGSGIWEYGTPAGTVINSAASGSQSWATGLSSTYGDIISDQNQVLFEDGFETDLGWAFTGEFERANPHTEHPPMYAYNGFYCIGTDLGGYGSNLYQYENGITGATAYTATSPPLDVSQYSNLQLSFARWVTIQQGDTVRLEISSDNGATWHPLWQNDGSEIMDTWWQQAIFDIPDEYIFTNEMLLRFSLNYSSPSGEVAQGWSIDDILLTGDLVNTAQGHLISPSFDLTGIADPLLEARMWVDTEQDVDGASLSYSLDDGETWTPVSNPSGYDSYWNWYTGNAVSALGRDGWSGQSGGWMTVRHLLPPAVINQENVQLRLTFAADKLNNQHDGVALDDVRIMEAPMDVGILDLLEPVSACELSPNQSITIRTQNFGLNDLQPGDSILVGFHIDRSGEIQSGEEFIHLSQVFPVGATRDFTLSTELDFSKSGEYLTDVYTIEEDPHFYQAISNDTVSRLIIVNKPAVDLGPDISTPRPDTVILRAYSGVGGQNYLWQDSSTDSLFHVSSEGTYWVRVTNGLGCVASDTIQVSQLTTDVGVSQFISPLSDCELGTQVPVQVSIRNFGTDTIAAGDTIMVFGNVNQTPSFNDTIFLVQAFRPGETIDLTFPEMFDFSTPGSYLMKLYTQYGEDVNDLNDTLHHTIDVWGYPDIDLGPDTVVVAGSYLLAPTPGYAEYLWQDASTLETFTVDEQGLGLYHVTVTDIHQCTSHDSVIVTLNVPDVAMDQILSPASSCELSTSITVAARVKNAGNQIIASGQAINMAYRINGGSLVQDILTLTSNFLPGHTIDFTFSQSESVETGQWYEFEVFVDYLEDVKSFNDTLVKAVGVFNAPVVDLGEEYQVVNDFQHTLDAGPGFISYEWQDGSTNQTFVVTQPGVGVYGVTVTDINGCVVYEEVQVMLAMPDVGVLEVSYPTTSCTGGEAEYIQLAIKNFGNWDIEASADIIVAYSLNGALAVVENMVLDTVLESGSVMYHTFSVTEDFSNPQHNEVMAFTQWGSDLNPSNNIILVNVDILGTPNVDIGKGEDSLLVYDPITLSATGGYASYQWQDGSTDTVYQISSPGAGLYHVLVTDENDCFTRDSVFVIYDMPDIGITQVLSPLSSCELYQNNPVSIEIINNGYDRISTGDTIIIRYMVDGGAPVIDSINLNPELQPGQTRVLTFSSGYDFSGNGSYQLDVDLDYEADENLSNNVMNSTVNVWGYPDVEIGGGLDTLDVDLPHTLDAGAVYSDYLWQDNSTGQWFDVTQNGLHWVVVTDANGCSGRDSVIMVTNVSMDEILAGEGKISIFPNPVQDILNIVVDMDTEKEVLLEIYSVLNTLVHQEEIMPAKLARTEVDVTDLSPGSYIVRITVDQIPHTSMVVVE